MNASEGLSSVASFSLGLSMSMRGSPVNDDPDQTSGHQHQPHHHHHHHHHHPGCSGPPTNSLLRPLVAPRKPSFQDLFPVQPAAVSPAAGGATKPGTRALARRRHSSIDPTKLARWIPVRASGFLARRAERRRSRYQIGYLMYLFIYLFIYLVS